MNQGLNAFVDGEGGRELEQVHIWIRWTWGEIGALIPKAATSV